ncbi:hypothetical protein [Mycolicibacterium sp. 120270]|uniref:hypothetical protein n=1 Tax=Mycolicibacterium sp. 120270 TaxID=3090600 RepID=UPI00299DEB9A|nr:hypothetical protein [Mycolicibacterium sp. 120270]MDX1885989.1 hypothetical protein [Mycolicibacterium sp. 120270]
MKTVVRQRTRSFARIIGPLLTIIPLVGLARAADMRQLLTEFSASDVWPWVTGALVLTAGVAIVAFHQIYRGLAAIIISVLGWLMVLRGVVLIAFPGVFASIADRMVDASAVWISGVVVVAFMGLYLTYVGWRPVTTELQGDQLHIDIEFPRAA